MVYGLNGIYAPNRVNWNSNFIEESYTSEDVGILSEELYTNIIYDDSIMIENTISMYYDRPQLLTESVKDTITKIAGKIRDLIERAKKFVGKYIEKFKSWLKERKNKKSTVISEKYGLKGKDSKGTWTMQYVIISGDRRTIYRENGKFDVLYGVELSTPIIIWRGINGIEDFTKTFDKLLDKVKDIDKRIKESMLKFERVDYSNNMTPDKLTDQLNKCVDDIDNLQQEAKDYIDNEYKKLAYGGMVLHQTKPTKQELSNVSQMISINSNFNIGLAEGQENKFIEAIQDSYDTVNHELNEYLKNLDPYINGKIDPFLNDNKFSFEDKDTTGRMNKGKLNHYYDMYVTKVTSMINYLSGKLSQIYNDRLENVSRYARDMLNNGEILEREKLKYLIENSNMKLMKMYD